MKKVYSIIIIIGFSLWLSCTHKTKLVEISLIKNENLGNTERGILINKIKEGYWITINNDSTIIIESYYVHGILNGPVKLYFDSGELMECGIMKDGKSSEDWIIYYETGKIRSKGTFFNGKKIGVWTYFSRNGTIDRKVLYANDTIKELINKHLILPSP